MQTHYNALHWVYSYLTMYFGVLHPVARTLSRLLEEPSLATTLSSCLFIFISPLHVFALAGHLQAEYTMIFGKLLHYNGSVVFVL
jgi:hypothetical protein